MLESYRDLIDELLGTPRELRSLFGGRAEPPAGATALLVGLRDRDRAMLERLQGMLREQDYLLRAMPDEIAEETAPVGPILDEFDTARGDLVSLLMNLTLKDWERRATHEIEGEITLAEVVEWHVEFDEERVAAIGERFREGGD